MRPFLSLVIVVLAACTQADVSVEPQQLFDPNDHVHPRAIELRAVRSDWALGLASEDMTATSVRELDGQTLVTVFTTGGHAASFERYGLVAIEGANVGAVQLAGGGADAGCDPDRPYFPDYDDIRMEMNAHATQAGIATFDLGPTYETDQVQAIQFGPIQKGSGPAPALLVTATTHAREWATTAVAMELMRHLSDVADLT